MRMHEITQLLHERRSKDYYSGEFEALNTAAKRDDTRRPRLTLMHLQRLRKRKDAADAERLQHLEMLPDMYGVISVDGKWKRA